MAGQPSGTIAWRLTQGFPKKKLCEDGSKSFDFLNWGVKTIHFEVLF
jgi:hypothetical protein